MLVVEHDLAILDLLTDTLHVAYGEPGAYGVITDPKSVRNGINEYLKGYLDNENMRIRPNAITFEEHAPRPVSTGAPLVEYPDLRSRTATARSNSTSRAGRSTSRRCSASSAPTGSASRRSQSCSRAA
jgi:Predicted ATPase, RNase L inhibitor (RLI) homolog